MLPVYLSKSGSSIYVCMVYQIFFLQSIRTFVCSRDLRKHHKTGNGQCLLVFELSWSDLIICIQVLGKEFFKMLNSAIQFFLGAY